MLIFHTKRSNNNNNNNNNNNQNNQHRVAFMVMGHFWPIPALFHMFSSLFMGLPEFLLPFEVVYVYFLHH